MAHDISFSTFLFAPPDEVMELFTNPQFIEEWSGAKASFDNKPGRKFEMFDGWATGEVLQSEPTQLSYTWKTADSESDEASVVHFRLEAVEHGTEVYVEHTGFSSSEEAESHKTGWKKYFFDPIEEYLSNRRL